MILTDIFKAEPSVQWQLMKQVGVNHAVVRLPEDDSFDLTNPAHMRDLTQRFLSRGLKPLVVEPMPNRVHDHIKRADEQRDECIEQVQKMIPLLAENGFTTICTNFMAEVGWYRSSSTYPERGGAKVTAFRLEDVKVDPALRATEEELWERLRYFLNAVVPVAEKHGVRIALHPDDPPLKKFGNISRILISKNNIQRAIELCPSPFLGVTLCQANYVAMGEDVYRCIEHFGRQGKIFFAHFRDIRGDLNNFHETFHDNGMTDMARAIRTYHESGFDGPIRVDHVPTMAGEENGQPGYETLGRLYAVGYLRGLCEGNGISLD